VSRARDDRELPEGGAGVEAHGGRITVRAIEEVERLPGIVVGLDEEHRDVGGTGIRDVLGGERDAALRRRTREVVEEEPVRHEGDLVGMRELLH
jgi:hypothetical protein